MQTADLALIKRLCDYQERSRTSWNKLAQMLKIGDASLSQWRNNKYPGNNQEINKSVERFLRIEDQKQLGVSKELAFVGIHNSDRIFTVLETAHADGVIGVIIGDTGTSKTETVKQYMKDNDVIYLEANRTYRMPNEYLRKIHQHKKVGKDGRGSLNAMYHDIVSELRGTNMLIIIDQADYLNLSAIDVFRAISEESGIGVVFVGLPSLLRKIRGNEPEVRQVRDRIKVKIELGSYTPEECKSILMHNWPAVKELSNDFFRWSNGSLRLLTGLVYNAKRIANNPRNADKSMDEKLIAKAASYLEIRTA